MKRKLTIFVLALSVPFLVYAYTSPGKPTGYVNDFAKVLSMEEKQSLEAKLSTLESQTGDQIAVVTIPSLGGDTVEHYAVKLYEEWGIGSKENDNGVLILVATEDHEVRIEVGYGLEGTVTDLQSGNIIRKVMIPEFQKGDFGAGIVGGVDAVTEIITGSPDALQYSDTSSQDSGSDANWAPLLFSGFFLINVLARVFGRTRSWWLGGVVGAGFGAIIGLIWGFMFAGVISVIILTLLGLLFDFLVSKSGGGPRRFWFGGLGGHGGSSGSSFGGFGGGMSGGGGASGKW